LSKLHEFQDAPLGLAESLTLLALADMTIRYIANVVTSDHAAVNALLRRSPLALLFRHSS